jgi:hypothetical protein
MTGLERGAGLTVRVAFHDRPATSGLGGGEIVAGTRCAGVVAPTSSASSVSTVKR